METATQRHHKDSMEMEMVVALRVSSHQGLADLTCELLALVSAINLSVPVSRFSTFEFGIF
jgi:hypothetical protein